jgi:hypothetical protein
VPISSTGGLEARWRRDGRELFYIALDKTLMAVDVTPGSPPGLGVPRRLFSLPIEPLSNARNHCDVARDGQRFLVVEEVPTQNPLAITVITSVQAAR